MDEGIKGSALSDGHSTDTNSIKSEDLCIMDEFDDLLQISKCNHNTDAEDNFIGLITQAKLSTDYLAKAEQECQLLQKEVVKKGCEYTDLERKLSILRKMIDHERQRTCKLTEIKADMEEKVLQVMNLLAKNKVPMSREIREELSDLSDMNCILNERVNNLSRIPENNTGSLLSDYTEDDSDPSGLLNNETWKAHKSIVEDSKQPETDMKCENIIKINSTDIIKAVTTVSISKDGPVTARSVLESLPQSNMDSIVRDQQVSNATYLFEEAAVKGHQHSFQIKTIFTSEICHVCKRDIGFARFAYKCKQCHALCHRECKQKLHACCESVGNLRTNRYLEVIGDYTPSVRPMIPSFLIKCFEEIERRGLNGGDIYKIDKHEGDINKLMEIFLNEKEHPCLTKLDVNVIGGIVKRFLGGLKEPLITYRLWSNFYKAVNSNNSLDVNLRLYELISDLPHPNQDTMACIILHLKRIANSPRSKMSIKNIIKVFAPLVVGYSSSEPSLPHLIVTERNQQRKIIEALLRISDDYWEKLVDFKKAKMPTCSLQQTPSTDSLLGLFSGSLLRRKKKIHFPLPPL